jgi:hypothetical protein
VAHDLFVEESVVAFDLGVALLFQHVLFLGDGEGTFLFILRRLSVMLIVLWNLRLIEDLEWLRSVFYRSLRSLMRLIWSRLII